MSGLSKRQVMMVVNRYIGVSGGYLGDFNYRTHADFYPEYCDLDIDPDQIKGTTRQRFIQILSTASPGDQARILRGVVERFPVPSNDAPETRTPKLQDTLEELAARLESSPQIPTPSISAGADSVHRALADAEHLIAQSGATSAVDRVHTALHGYLKVVCGDAGISVTGDDTLTTMFKAARKAHPALAAQGPRSGDIDKILRGFSAILDALSPLRNKASMAHPQDALLEQPEAMLVVHAARTLLHYLDTRLSRAIGEDRDQIDEVAS